MSLPLRERGLKSLFPYSASAPLIVAPFAGAWIEIQRHNTPPAIRRVAPFAGAWIEIFSYMRGLL